MLLLLARTCVEALDHESHHLRLGQVFANRRRIVLLILAIGHFRVLSLRLDVEILEHARLEFKGLAEAGHRCFIGRFPFDGDFGAFLLNALQV